jgi:hypothetical protein
MERAAPTPTIEDHRQHALDVPAVEVLERILPIVPTDLRGIRTIVLFDRDYRRKKAAARYVALRGTRGADIELFLDHYVSLPETLRTSRIYVTFYLGWSLMHEIYHHRVRGQKRLRKPTDRLEDQRADRWAHDRAHRILETIFPREQHQEEYARIRKAREEMTRTPGSESC